jgi:hypothetical protein
MTVWQNGLTKVAALLTALCALPAARGAALGCAEAGEEKANAALAIGATVFVDGHFPSLRSGIMNYEL